MTSHTTTKTTFIHIVSFVFFFIVKHLVETYENRAHTHTPKLSIYHLTVIIIFHIGHINYISEERQANFIRHNVTFTIVIRSFVRSLVHSIPLYSVLFCICVVCVCARFFLFHLIQLFCGQNNIDGIGNAKRQFAFI